uniref:Uncharacterized protein n=1 Tax=Oryza sativa subsp. japonica TaxID=39947 RepID=Q5Z7S0_ORYSJ|nr:hypothetical protein [Oryza sativa Japonica Group]
MDRAAQEPKEWNGRSSGTNARLNPPTCRERRRSMAASLFLRGSEDRSVFYTSSGGGAGGGGGRPPHLARRGSGPRDPLRMHGWCYIVRLIGCQKGFLTRMKN